MPKRPLDKKENNQAEAPSEQEIRTYLKRWIKNHDPEYVKKRQDYAKDQFVKKRRTILNARRRNTLTTLYQLAKQKTIVDEDGNVYTIKYNRLIKEREDGKMYVVKADKKGDLYEYRTDGSDIQLIGDEFDAPIDTSPNKKEMEQYVKLLLNGDEKINALVKQKKILIDVDVPESELYWKDDKTKEDLMEKLVKKET